MSKKLFVGNLDFKTTEKDLNEMFESFGAIEDVFVVKDHNTNRSKGFGFVTFTEDDDAQKAVSEMNEKEIKGRKITVNVAKEREESHSEGHGRDRPRFERREEEPQDEYSRYFSTKLVRE